MNYFHLKLNLDELIKKYEKQLEDFIIMDDYDGGEYAHLRKVIRELKNIQKSDKFLGSKGSFSQL